MKLFKNLFRSLPTLLAPKIQNCLSCHRAIHRSNNHNAVLGIPHTDAMVRALRRSTNPFHDLCDTCLHSMPWIRSIRCPVCGRATGCPDCSRRGKDHTYFQQNRSAVAYSPQMRDWLAAYKYRGDERYLPLLGSMLLTAYYQLCGEQTRDNMPVKYDCITYVPVSPSRLQERGFNQAEQFARTLHAYTGIPVIALLQRNRHTVKQSMKSRGDRIEDMKDVFSLHIDSRQQLFSKLNLNHMTAQTQLRPIRILLIDDVYTTGSTVNACAKSLSELSNDLNTSILISSLTWARS
ncbi:ComF family protein [Paenibacillus terrigena]|uniref:ComF family protein n=1 Tax=Paenibacillus terrigena TaxID=369333 RepID=UPI0003A89843|nr:ComF family protein [Paenibacillus terrigena]